MNAEHVQCLEINFIGDQRRRSMWRASKYHLQKRLKIISKKGSKKYPSLCCCPVLFNIKKTRSFSKSTKKSPDKRIFFHEHRIFLQKLINWGCDVPQVSATYVGRPPRPDDLEVPFLAKEAVGGGPALWMGTGPAGEVTVGSNGVALLRQGGAGEICLRR